MASYPVTRVRYTEEEAQHILRVFVFGGHFGTDRPPRGIDPKHFTDFIVKHVPVSGEADVYGKVLHALRFYELGDAVPHLLKTLDQPVDGREGVQRCCWAIQAGADVGSPTAELMGRLCRFFDDVLVPWERVFLMRDTELANARERLRALLEGIVGPGPMARYEEALPVGFDAAFVADAPIGRWCQGIAWSKDSKTVLAQCMVEEEIFAFRFSGITSKSLQKLPSIKTKGGPAGIRTAE